MGSGNRSDTRDQGHHLYALHSADGALRWRGATPAAVIGRPAVLAGVAAAAAVGPDGGSLVCGWSLETGAPLWRRAVPIFAANLRAEKEMLVAGPPGRARRTGGDLELLIDPRTGARVGQRRRPPLPYVDGPAPAPGHAGDLRSAARGASFFGDNDQFFAHDRDSGRTLWRFSVPEVARTISSGGGEAPPAIWYAEPALVGGRVIFSGSFAAVYALDARTGAPRWRAGTRAGVPAGPLVGGSVVYFGDAEGTLHAVDLSTGALLWQLQEDRRSKDPGEQGLISAGIAGIARDERTLYVSSNGEILLALRR